MELKEVKVGEWYMKYDETCREGVRHLLEDLSFDECKVFFNQAYAKGAAQFEDDEDRQFTLYYQNGGYLLTRRRTTDW
jgi:hypothetical protein